MSHILTVYNPYTRQPLAELPLAGWTAADAALATAHRLYTRRGEWLPAWRRLDVLHQAAQLMEGPYYQQLLTTAAEEGGKPWADTVVELDRAINGVRHAAAVLQTSRGQGIPMGLTQAATGRLAYTTPEPVGVVLAVSAFNHPINLIVHQAVTAVAVGAPVVVRPASTTPRSALLLQQILAEAGLPDGWMQVLVCGRDVAERMVQDRRLGFFSFIGSGAVGWRLRSLLAPGVGCALEHGGAAPVVLADDADWQSALPGLTKAAFYHAGQVCVSVQRVYAPVDTAMEVAQALAVRASQLKAGNPLEPSTEVGPLIAESEVQRVHGWVSEAIDTGSKLLCGGEPIGATCYQPTVLLNPPDTAKVSNLEIFGPVVCVYGTQSLDEAVVRANSVPFAFQAAGYTRSLDTALHLSQALNATAVMINDHTAFRVDWMPFGGYKESGLGLGGIPYTMRDYTRERMTVIKCSSL